MSVSVHTDFHGDTLISPIPLSSWIWWLAFGVTSRQRTRPHSPASSPSPPLFLPPTEWIEKTGDLAVGLWGKWATSCHRLNWPFETWFAGFERVSDCKADKWRECEGVPFIQKIKKKKGRPDGNMSALVLRISLQDLYRVNISAARKKRGEMVAVNPYSAGGKL